MPEQQHKQHQQHGVTNQSINHIIKINIVNKSRVNSIRHKSIHNNSVKYSTTTTTLTTTNTTTFFLDSKIEVLFHTQNLSVIMYLHILFDLKNVSCSVLNP